MQIERGGKVWVSGGQVSFPYSYMNDSFTMPQEKYEITEFNTISSVSQNLCK